MASKRATLLMAILLLLVLGYVSQPFWATRVSGPHTSDFSPLPGTNSISGLKVHQDIQGRWMADFDYFYTGAPQNAFLMLGLDTAAPSAELSPHLRNGLRGFPPKHGSHHISVEIQRPSVLSQSFTTTQIWVQLRGTGAEPPQSSPAPGTQATHTFPFQTFASQQIDQTIDWPDMQTWLSERQFANKTEDEILNDAVAQIDAGNEISLAQAKHALERLVSRNPQLAQGYVELARVAMKSNWGPEGLHQAETLIQSALQVQPDSVNAKILLGYVYAHQKRYKAAEKLFMEAASSNPRNLWLWANWGEVLVMQNQFDQGIEKYRQAILRPRTNDTYDRARLDAYRHLITLLDKRNDLDGTEALYKQRAQEFGSGNCYYYGYARFVLQRRGDPAQAIALARKAVDGHCPDPEAREVLGLAHYVAWATAPAAQRAELLNQARVFFPIGPRPLYSLAVSERTLPALRELIKTGESIDQYDNEKYNALAYAMQFGDYATAKRLIRLGARLDAPIGSAQLPLALLPVIQGEVEGVLLMKKSGLDYSKLHYQGKSGLELAKLTGDRKLIDALASEGGSI